MTHVVRWLGGAVAASLSVCVRIPLSIRRRGGQRRGGPGSAATVGQRRAVDAGGDRSPRHLVRHGGHAAERAAPRHCAGDRNGCGGGPPRRPHGGRAGSCIAIGDPGSVRGAVGEHCGRDRSRRPRARIRRDPSERSGPRPRATRPHVDGPPRPRARAVHVGRVADPRPGRIGCLDGRQRLAGTTSSSWSQKVGDRRARRPKAP